MSMGANFHKIKSFFSRWTCLGLSIAILATTLPGCFPVSNLYVQEYDDVYSTNADRESEEARRAQIEQLPPDSLAKLMPPKRERKKMDPRTKRFVYYVLGGLLQVAFDVGIYILLTI